MTQGTPADAAYLVLEGAAELVLERVVATDEGEETVTRASSRTVGAGEFVGEAAMLDGERTYGASAVATRRTVAIEVRKEEFAAALAAASEEDRARVRRVAADRRALLREMSAKLRIELTNELRAAGVTLHADASRDVGARVSIVAVRGGDDHRGAG